MDMQLHIKNLQIGYRKKVIGETFSATVSESRGQLILLVGRNGSGKSTLLRTLAGLQSELSGEITLNGEALAKMDTRKRATLLSFVQTRPPAYTDLTVGEVVALGAYPIQLQSDSEEVRSSLNKLGVSSLAHQRLDSISDGERQKAMIARALVQDTPIILMDEPTAFLDYPSRIDWWRHVAEMRETGKLLIVSTHDLAMVKDVTVDRFWLLNRKGGFFKELNDYDEVLQQLISNS